MRNSRFQGWRAWGSAMSLAVIALALFASPAASELGWQPWLGCWELTVETVDYLEDTSDGQILVCLKPGPAAETVAITTLADGELVLEEILNADGVRHPVEARGCRGWRSAEWSRDGRRVFLHSRTTCEGGVQREVSGVSLIAPHARWVDIQLITTGDMKELVIRRYRLADPETTAQAGFETVAAGESVREARRAAARAIGIDEVIEAIRSVGPEVAEASLLETDADLDIDSKALGRLADAHVPPRLIDLMVALAYPSRFNIDRLGLVERAEPRQVGTPMLDTGGPDWYDYGYPFYFAPFGYYSYYWDAPYGGYYILPSTGVTADSGGRVVNDQGYTRVWPKEDRAQPRDGGGFWQGGGYSQSDSSRGSASSEGYSSGGASSERTAHPRPKP